MGALGLCLALTLAAPPSAPRSLGPKPPVDVRRVVTLAPSLTETMIALGLKDRLVGVSRFDEAEAVKSLPRVGGFVDPSVEAVVALKPDLLIVQPAPGNQRPVEKMAELGVPVLLLPLHTVKDVLTAIRKIGDVLGVQNAASRLATHIEETRSRIRQRASSMQRPRVLFIYGYEPLVVAGPGSFADELLRDAGGTNAASKATAPYPTYSAESAVRAKPDVVVNAVMANEAGADKLRSLPGLLQARWVKIPSQDMLHPGPALAEGLEQLFALLHPALDGG